MGVDQRPAACWLTAGVDGPEVVVSARDVHLTEQRWHELVSAISDLMAVNGIIVMPKSADEDATAS